MYPHLHSLSNPLSPPSLPSSLTPHPHPLFPTTDVFVIVQEEYKREGLKWEAIKCMDNSAALELLEGRLGIIDLLNEESMRGQGNDINFLAKMKSLCGAHPCYVSGEQQVACPINTPYQHTIF